MKKSKTPCFCGSNIPYRRCCRKRKFWALVAKNPNDYLISTKIDDAGSCLIVFSSKDRAINFLNEDTTPDDLDLPGDNEDTKDTTLTEEEILSMRTVPVSFKMLIKIVLPMLEERGVRSLAVDLADSRGTIFNLEGFVKSICTERLPVPDGVHPYTDRDGTSAEMDFEWFVKTDEKYLLRPPITEEIHESMEEDAFMFVVRPSPRQHLKFVCNPGVIGNGDVSEVDWDQIAQNLIECTAVDQQTNDFIDQLRGCCALYRKMDDLGEDGLADLVRSVLPL